MENISVFPRRFSDSTGFMDEKMARYFGGDRTLSSDKVVELLVSTSFGANSILYAVWLGYLMGIWAMLIHIAWCISFCALSMFSKQIYNYTSIHDFLFCHYGKVIKKIAAACSGIGLLYFTGWEIAIAKSSVESFAVNSAIGSSKIWSWLLLVIICIALLYTVIGGQHANGYINLVVNRIKMCLLAIVVIGLFYALSKNDQGSIALFVPDLSNAIKNLGFFGLVTNIFINLSWQFVDNSSWQIICSGCKVVNDNAKCSLRKAAIRIFLIYAGETLLGASLRGVSGLNSDNVLSGIIDIIGNHGSAFLIICTILLILFSVMSLIDGMSLSVAQTVMIDLNFGRYFNKIKRKSQSGLHVAQILTLLLGVLAAWGIQLILGGVGKNIFDFVYIFTLVQLSLIGPIVIELVFNFKYIPKMWLSVVLSLILGFSCHIFGNLGQLNWLSDASGTVAAITSLVLSLYLFFLHKDRFYITI